MTENSSTASNDGNDGAASDTGNPNDLGTEMSAEAEAAFVDRQLGITDSGAEIGGKGDEDGSESTGEASGKESGEDADGSDSTGTDGKDGSGGGSDNSTGQGDSTKSEEDGASSTGAKDGKEPEDASDKQGNDDQVDKSTAQLEGVDASDLWVEIEDSSGKTHKIGVGDSLPEDFSFKNDAQLAEYLEARREMKDTLNQRQSEFNESQEKANAAKAEQEQFASWDAEVNALVDAKLLDAPKALPKDGKQYTEDEIKADPALQKINSIYAYMGAHKLRSFGTAYTLWSQGQAAEKEKQELEEDNRTAKARGSLVGGSSSSSGSDAGYVYKAGSASSIHDVDTSDI